MNHDEGNPIAGEVEYGGMNDSLMMNVDYMLNEEHNTKWLEYYLDYVEFLNEWFSKLTLPLMVGFLRDSRP